MSISSVPGANSVFFASLPIDSLPIDKIWERVCRVAAPVKSRGRKVSLLSNRMRPARPQLSDTTPQFNQSTSDKAVLLKAALEGYLRRVVHADIVGVRVSDAQLRQAVLQVEIVVVVERDLMVGVRGVEFVGVDQVSLLLRAG